MADTFDRYLKIPAPCVLGEHITMKYEGDDLDALPFNLFFKLLCLERLPKDPAKPDQIKILRELVDQLGECKEGDVKKLSGAAHSALCKAVPSDVNSMLLIRLIPCYEAVSGAATSPPVDSLDS